MLRGKRLKRRPIPEKEEDLSAEDGMMMMMKGVRNCHNSWQNRFNDVKAGYSWSDINVKWAEMTGEMAADLHSRYRRIKAALDRVEDEHLDALEVARKEVDQEIEGAKLAMERKRWNMVADKLQTAVGKKYEVKLRA